MEWLLIVGAFILALKLSWLLFGDGNNWVSAIAFASGVALIAAYVAFEVVGK